MVDLVQVTEEELVVTVENGEGVICVGGFLDGVLVRGGGVGEEREDGRGGEEEFHEDRGEFDKVGGTACTRDVVEIGSA